MAISMFRSFGMQERIAGNTREKQRALNAAVSAQQYAEYVLSSATVPVAASCTGVVSSTVGQICNNPPNDFTVLPWTNAGAAVGVTYTQFTMSNGNSVQANVTGTAPAVGSYYLAPVYYISDKGQIAINGVNGELYQIDAAGYGGTANAVAVVESTFFVPQATPNGLDPAGTGGG
jgi:type IV pilus assembly protein PilX